MRTEKWELQDNGEDWDRYGDVVARAASFYCAAHHFLRSEACLNAHQVFVEMSSEQSVKYDLRQKTCSFSMTHKLIF